MSKKNDFMKNLEDLKLILPQKEVEIIEPEQFEEMSLVDVQHEKEMLSAQRQQVMLKLDGRKLKQAVKLMDAMDMILDRMLDITIDKDSGLPVWPDAQDIKFLASAYKDLSSMFSNSVRLDSVDTGGKAAAINLRIEFEQG